MNDSGHLTLQVHEHVQNFRRQTDATDDSADRQTAW